MSDEIPVEPDEIESGTGPSDTDPSEDRGDLGVTAGAGLGDDVPAPPLSDNTVFVPETDVGETLRPTLTTAAALLDDPLAEIPYEPDEETPPDPTPLTDKMHGPRGTPKRDAWDALQRERGKAAHAEIMANPAVSAFAQEESRRLEQKAQVQAAFVKAWKEKNKK